jgi:hypothetical protein
MMAQEEETRWIVNGGDKKTPDPNSGWTGMERATRNGQGTDEKKKEKR